MTESVTVAGNENSGRRSKYPPGTTRYQKRKLLAKRRQEEQDELLDHRRIARVRDWQGFRRIIVSELSVQDAREIALKLIEKAKQGQMAAITELFNRTDGKAPVSISAGRKDGSSLALDTLKQMPLPAALEQLDAAEKQLAKLRGELNTQSSSNNNIYIYSETVQQPNEANNNNQDQTQSETNELEADSGVDVLTDEESGDEKQVQSKVESSDAIQTEESRLEAEQESNGDEEVVSRPAAAYQARNGELPALAKYIGTPQAVVFPGKHNSDESVNPIESTKTN